MQPATSRSSTSDENGARCGSRSERSSASSACSQPARTRENGTPSGASTSCATSEQRSSSDARNSASSARPGGSAWAVSSTTALSIGVSDECPMDYPERVSVPPGRRTRWKDRADDPELERELIEELDRRRRAREEDRERRAQERRSRWVIWLFVLLTAARGGRDRLRSALEVARSLFG